MDSDSSGDEQDGFTTTNVLLGYAAQEETDDTISHLGGLPSWLHSSAPSAALARCLICKDIMSLLLQLHADLPERFPGHDRRLHIFSCRRKTCRRKPGSVRVLRSSRIDPAAQATLQVEATTTKPETQDSEQPAKTKSSLLGNDLFGGSKPTSGGSALGKANPFATGGGLGGGAFGGIANPFSISSASELAAKPAQKPTSKPSISSSNASDLPATFASKAKISAPSPSPSISSVPVPHEPWPTDSSIMRPYPQFFLDADYEALGDGPPAPPQASQQLMEVETEDAPGASGNGTNTADDATADMSLDRTFQRFADRLWHNPEQVLRYEFGGKPLIYSDRDAVGKALNAAVSGKGSGSGVPGCKICGAKRLFECQLTPHAIAELETVEEALEGMEWGTMIVGVCERDCVPVETGKGEVGYVEEWIGVQWEESKK